MNLADGEGRRGSLKTMGIVAACAAALLGVFVYLWLGGPAPKKTTSPSLPGDNSPEGARKALEKDTDLLTCRNALTQLNSYYQQTTEKHPPTLDKKNKEQLQQRFGAALDSTALTEIEGNSYTLLDGHHLDQCFLMRDAARALEGDTRGPALKPLERATNAFAWVVRQVRLQDGFFRVVPPQFALRRGWGTPYDRALIFLELLNQMSGDHFCGCLVGWPKQANELPELWACGVLIDNDPNLYLFDPRLGLPLPGSNGEGVATLAAVRKEPALLDQLNVKKGNEYDVTQKRAQEAEIYQYCSLSALAPRMRFLQDELLPPSVRVHLGVDPLGDEKKLTAATRGDEKPIKVFPSSPVLLRQFLPKEEGGADVQIEVALANISSFVEAKNNFPTKLPPRQIFELELTPWGEMYPYFRDPQKFPFNIGLGQRVRQVFMDPFVKFTLGPKLARDNMLRGDYKEAIKALSGENQETIDQKREWDKIKDNKDLPQQVETWVEQALKAYADLLRAEKQADPAAREEAMRKVNQVWANEGAGLVLTILNGNTARPRGVETSYYLALCKHEQAELAQRRLDAQPAEGKRGNADKEWQQALDKWEPFVSENPNAPEREAARRLYGRAQLMLGHSKEAVDIWESEIPESKHKLETVACLYLASRQKKK